MGPVHSDCRLPKTTALVRSSAKSDITLRKTSRLLRREKRVNDKDKIADRQNAFTAVDKKFIRQTWSHLHINSQHGHDVDADRGVRVFERIFQLVPDARQFFKNLGEMETVADMTANSRFRLHAVRFITAVDMVVDNLDALEIVVVPTLLQLGRMHVALPSFSKRYVHAFEEAMDHVWSRDLGWWMYVGRTRTAWRKLFNYITTLVIEGYTSTSGCTTDSEIIGLNDSHE